MTIVSVEVRTEGSGIDQGLRRIELSDGSLLTIRICYLPPVFDITASSEIGETGEESIRIASACVRAEKKALQLISTAEQNTFGLTRKLEKSGHDKACIRAVIDRLCELKLLDDKRYARLWVESRICRLATSPRRLLIGLCARGIDRDDSESALKNTIDTETELLILKRFAEKLQRKKKFSGSRNDASGDARRALKYTLKSEGFSSAAIQQFFEEA